MYPGVKLTDPVHSGTSVFYQAIPAVGADGNNIMKLIPVQMVNRQLVKSWMSQPKTDPPPQNAVTTNHASAPVWMAKATALNPPAKKQDKHPLQQENVNLMAIVPPMATTVANSGTSGRRPSQLPVTVKSPSLPRGRCHQSPAMAQVQAVPASELPAGIKTQTFTSSTNSFPSVVYTSPNTSVNQGVTSQSDSVHDMLTLLCKTSNTTSCGPPSKGPKPHLKLIPQVSQRPNSPIKWSVEEVDNPAAPTLDPIDSPVTSEILRVVAEREHAGKHCDVITKPGPTFNPINSSVTSEILRVAAERENAVKHHDFLTKPVSGSSHGPSAQGQRHPFDISSMKHPLQQENIHLMAIVPPMATPVANSGTSGRRPSQLPVTVKSPSLPRGRCHQSPAAAQVQSVPASELPASIKTQTFTSSTNSSLSSGLASAVYVSPMTSVNQSVTSQSDSVLDMLTLLCKTSNTTSCGPPSKGPKPHLKLIPQASQRPNSPIKWSVEEVDNPEALDPIDSPVTSEILRVVAERENAAAQHKVLTKPVYGSSHGPSAQGQRHPFDMSNRMVFLGAKNCSQPYKMRKSNSPTPARTSYEFNKTIPTSYQQSLESATPQRKQSLGLLRPDEVIDLCDDEVHSSQRAASLHTSAVAHSDEDNVIFVSYIPPQPESHYLRLKPQMDVVKETDQTGTSSWSNVAELKSLDGTADALRRRILGQSPSATAVRTHTRVCGSAVTNTRDNLDSNISSQRSTCTRQPKSMRGDVESTSPADGSTSDSSSGICSQIKKDGHKMESSMYSTTSGTSSLPPESCQISDHLLRRIFGITADVKIYLRRVDGSIFWSPPAEPPDSESIRSVEDHQEPMNGLKKTELFLQDFYSPQETASCNDVMNVRRLNVPSERELSEAATCPLKSSHFKQENTWCSGNSSLKGTWSDVETVIGYVEPIDEDFLSTDDNSQDKAAGQQTRTCVDLDSNTRRMGRKRKRTTCPCCIPGTRDPRAKSSTEEPEKWAWTTERAGKRGGRAKAGSKDVKTSGRSDCLTAKDKQSCKSSEDAASDGFSAASSDSEVKLHKQIMRLKEQLQEKEAALELMRTSQHFKL